MIPEINIDNVLSVTEEYYNRVDYKLKQTVNTAFSKDVYGFSGDGYEKALSIHHIGFVIFLYAFTRMEEERITREEGYYEKKFNLQMLRNYLQCLGIRDDATMSLIADNLQGGIGSMEIEGQELPFQIQ